MQSRTGRPPIAADDPCRTKFQEAIIEWQKREGLTRMMGAQRSGVSYFTITALMTGTSKRPSAQTLQKLVQAGVVIDIEVLKSL
jgi:hypothetical protein